jgi:mRNA interferase RelE/StbE
MYKVRILREAAKDSRRLPNEYKRLVRQHIDALEENPRPQGVKKLQERSDYSLRVGVYRIIYEIDDESQVVSIFRIKHRGGAYRNR